MAKLNDITFVKTNGGMGRAAESGDPISGLIMYLPELANTDLINANNAMSFDTIDSDDGANTLYAAQLRYTAELADYGITLQSMKAADVVNVATVAAFKKQAAINAIYYHVSEFFRMSPNGTLYLMIRTAGNEVAPSDVLQLQYYAGGNIRQCGIFTPTYNNISTVVNYQTVCTQLEVEHQPLSVVVSFAGKTVEYTQSGTAGSYVYTAASTSAVTLSNLASTSVNSILTGRCNISLLVGCDLAGDIVEMLGQYGYYGVIGLTIGAISAAAVHECIAYVAKFPLSLKQPGLVTGELIKDVSVANQERINDNRYIFVRTHVGDANNYFNDSHTLDLPTSDYAYIENERTIDKAVRGVRANLLPHLNAPLYVDAETGKLSPTTVSYLETVAGKALEDMERAGELSGYSVEIDPAQNVLSTSQVEMIIKKVGVGVMRKVSVKIGYTTSLAN